MALQGGAGGARVRRVPALVLLLAVVALLHVVLLRSARPGWNATPSVAAHRPVSVVVVAPARAAQAPGPARREAPTPSPAPAPTSPAAAPAPASPPWPSRSGVKPPARTAPAGPRPAPPAWAQVAPREAAPAWPVEAVRLPEAFSASYHVRRGNLTGEALMVWQPAASIAHAADPGVRAPAYEATLVATLAGERLFEWRSRGTRVEHGLAPERFVAHGRRGRAAAANFQREAGKITYAGPAVAHPLPDAAQDRLSALLQAAGIVAATPERFAAPGAQIALFVTGARGDAQVWTFESRGIVDLANEGEPPADLHALPQPVPGALPRPPLPVVHLVREAVALYDQRVEIWLDAAAPAAPLRMRFTTVGREPEAMQLDRAAAR